ncbi:SDR family NAD(P)-dependent oxidoreductase [Agromyces bauzanensis]
MVSGPVALVTGAAGALGSVMASVLATRGWSLALAGMPGEPLDELARRLESEHENTTISTHVADLAVPTEATGLVIAAAERHGRIDGLVNNAGRPARSTFKTITVDEWDAAMAVNLRAPMLTMKAFVRVYDPAFGPGAIVNISSRTYATGGPPGYVAAKAGLVGLTRAAAYEFGKQGIRVNAVAPSMMATPFTAGSRSSDQLAASMDAQARMSALHRLPDIAEIAAGVAYLIGPDATYVTGEVLHIAGGLQLPPMPS